MWCTKSEYCSVIPVIKSVLHTSTRTKKHMLPWCNEKRNWELSSRKLQFTARHISSECVAAPIICHAERSHRMFDVENVRNHFRRVLATCADMAMHVHHGGKIKPVDVYAVFAAVLTARARADSQSVSVRLTQYDIVACAVPKILHSAHVLPSETTCIWMTAYCC